MIHSNAVNLGQTKSLNVIEACPGNILRAWILMIGLSQMAGEWRFRQINVAVVVPGAVITAQRIVGV